MRLLIDIGHPAHVHFYKNIAWSLEKKGHEVCFTSRNKDVALALLNAYSIPHHNLGEHSKGMFEKSFGMLIRDLKLYNVARNFKPDILTGIHNPYIAHVAKLLGKPSVTVTDTEYVGIASKLTFPFTDTICTPSCFREELDPSKHVKFNGYKELAYLRPNQFKPDPAVVEELGLSKKEPFIILRFISWNAAHDTHLRGIDKGSELSTLKSLEKYGRVFITSERKMSSEFEPYRISVAPEKMHSLLYYSSLYFGEGGTMAGESAMLGTPAIHVETADISKPCAASFYSGNFNELRDKYGLLYMYQSQDEGLKKAVEILEDPSSKKKWQAKREKLLKDKVDVAKFFVDFFERYPDSFRACLQKK